jgi:hypothetical protein
VKKPGTIRNWTHLCAPAATETSLSSVDQSGAPSIGSMDQHRDSGNVRIVNRIIVEGLAGPVPDDGDEPHRAEASERA